MKLNHYILLIFISFAGILFAQDSNQPNLDELHNRKWDYIVEKAKLTTKEAARVKPLFLEYEKAIWVLTERNKEFFREFYHSKENRSEAQYAEMNDRFVNSNVMRANLLKNYYQKLKKQLSSESIFKYFNAERSFRKELINKWSDRHKRHRNR